MIETGSRHNIKVMIIDDVRIKSETTGLGN